MLMVVTRHFGRSKLGPIIIMSPRVLWTITVWLCWEYTSNTMFPTYVVVVVVNFSEPKLVKTSFGSLWEFQKNSIYMRGGSGELLHICLCSPSASNQNVSQWPMRIFQNIFLSQLVCKSIRMLQTNTWNVWLSIDLLHVLYNKLGFRVLLMHNRRNFLWNIRNRNYHLTTLASHCRTKAYQNSFLVKL